MSSTEVDAWAPFAEQVIGGIAERRDGSVLVRTDGAPYRLQVEPGDRTELRRVGWDLGGPQRWSHVIQAAGRVVDVSVAGADECAAHRVVALARFTDPTGVVHELLWGRARVVTRPFVSPAGVSRFLDGIGHVVLFTDHATATRDLLLHALDLQVSDYRTGAWFLRCNHRHHAIAVVQSDAARVHHVMFEVGELDDVGRAYDRANSAGVVARELGRHSNDRMFSFYLHAPGGMEVEYGWGGVSAGDDWIAHEIDGGDAWGHEVRPRPEAMS